MRTCQRSVFFNMADNEDETYELCNLKGSFVSLAMFKDVTNCKELRQAAIDGNIEAALLKPKMLINPLQVLLAAHKAIHNNKMDKLKTKTLYSEIIFNLSPTNNISDSFRKFGLADGDDSVLIATISSDAQKMSSVTAFVQGNRVPVNTLSTSADREFIKKTLLSSEWLPRMLYNSTS
ncbi:EKC/KEOPS complex subunit Tprkb isoform X2 [Nematostella vectensis]|uniref:EKC/KEOPS complex subunit Tprkb isoform X2 n=1 Tax=Nematostella vectensis TaxID=45351 RepID=UPI002076E410|nr:EKC/KEOPS complex subunit Tprkb isoform X2 [Nematostella vectensis]